MKTYNLETINTSKHTYEIKAMRMADIDAVAEVERRCYTLTWNPNAYVTELGNSNAYYAVAKRSDGRTVGYGGIWVIIDELHVTTLAVDPLFRGHKLGERLLNAMMDEGIRRGALRATLEVRQSNVVAQSLYHKYGFQDVAQRRAYYSDNGENAIIMWAEDLTSPAYQQMLYEYRTHFAD
jgi:ribosomal-protein-alanine N-acetyltransferase